MPALPGRTIPCLALPYPAYTLPILPCLTPPHRALPCLTAPVLPFLAAPDHTEARQAMTLLPFHASAFRASPGLDTPVHAAPRLNCQAKPLLPNRDLPCPAIPELASACLSVTFLPCHAVPDRAAPCLAPLVRAMPFQPNLARPRTASTRLAAPRLYIPRRSCRTTPCRSMYPPHHARPRPSSTRPAITAMPYYPKGLSFNFKHAIGSVTRRPPLANSSTTAH